MLASQSALLFDEHPQAEVVGQFDEGDELLLSFLQETIINTNSEITRVTSRVAVKYFFHLANIGKVQ